MAPYHVLFARRSDGKAQTKSSSKLTPERNEPTPEQLDTKPNDKGISDYYRECVVGDTKEVDWRRKLAGMLVREVGGAHMQNKNYILAAFPENYRLFEHVKCKVSADGSTLDSGKNHAAGANERQDAYLYGHPDGRRKRFRSPAEFFPHLLWLCTDETGDSGNCTCRFCSPEELEDDKIKAKELKEASKKAASPAPTIKQESNVKQESNAKQATAVKQEPLLPPRTSTKPNITPLPLPPLRSMEQKIDLQTDQFFFRQGEIAWFNRGDRWGLGVIIDRRKGNSGITSAQYRIQPLSHPYEHPPPKFIQHGDLRPWLAWSAPPCTAVMLGNHTLNYRNIDWSAAIAGRYGQGDAEVDASIMGVKMVETTFTPFDPIPKASQTPPGETRYNGAYIGAEKIWVGDALRVRVSQRATDMLILHAIVERPSSTDPSHPVLTLVGDLYQYEVDLGRDPQSKETMHLPARVRQDLQLRNAITRSHKERPSEHYWKLFDRRQLMLCEFKGRYYETNTLAPLLNNNSFNLGKQQGVSHDVTANMNAQGDCNKAPLVQQPTPATVKADTREEAFYRAIPRGTTISRGLDQPSAQAMGLILQEGVGPETSTPGRSTPLQQSSTPVQTQASHQQHPQSQPQSHHHPQQPQLQQQQQQQQQQRSANPAYTASNPYASSTSTYQAPGYNQFPQTPAYQSSFATPHQAHNPSLPPQQPQSQPQQQSQRQQPQQSQPQPQRQQQQQPPPPKQAYQGYDASQASNFANTSQSYTDGQTAQPQAYRSTSQSQPMFQSTVSDQEFEQQFMNLDNPTNEGDDMMPGFEWDGGFYGGQT